MNIGDKVRFLSDTGGGTISGFRGKNIVLVADEDGFEIPTPITDIIPADQPSPRPKPTAPKAAPTDDTDDPSVGFTPRPRERVGGDRLSVCLAFVPLADLDPTRARYATYLVNDSNYHLLYSYATAPDGRCRLRSAGQLEPNTKLLVETIDATQLNDIAAATVQILAYKPGKPYELQPTLDTRFRIDGRQFHKANTFRENDFFDTAALLYTLIQDGKPMQANPAIVVDDTSDIKIKVEHRQPARTDSPRDSLTRRYEPAHTRSAKATHTVKDDKLIVDLHIDSLLDTTAGMNPHDILEYQLDVFRRTINENTDRKGQKIIFIHGKGEGVLRHAIIHELNYRYKNCQYQDASFRDYGYGATQVTIR